MRGFYDTINCQDTPNVIGVMVLNNEGFPIKSNLDNTTTVQYGHTIADLVEKVTLVDVFTKVMNDQHRPSR